MTNDLLTVEALIHRVEPIALFEMPLFRLLSPGVFSHVGPVSEKTLLSIEGLLFFSLACIMHPRSSWLAVAIFLLSSGHMILNNGMGVYLPLFIALVLIALVIRSNDRSIGSSLMLATAIGLSLLYRSVLSFFPPVLVIFEYYCYGKHEPRAFLKQSIVLLLAPYLFLIPWIWLNWTVYTDITVFERGEAVHNIETSLLGLTQVIELWGNARHNWPGDFSSEPSLSGTVTVFLQEFISHPFRYLWNYLNRVGYVIFTRPFLWVLALVGLWLHRKREEFQYLALFLAYFIGIHCVMSVQDSYFNSLLPLLSILAATALIRLIPGSIKPNKIERGLRLAGLGLAVACSLPVLALGLYAEWVVSSYAAWYPDRASRPGPDPLDAAIERWPEDGALIQKRGILRLQKNELLGAEQDFIRAVQLGAPDRLLIVCQILKGTSPPLESRCAEKEHSIAGCGLASFAAFKAGRRLQAQTYLQKAWELQEREWLLLELRKQQLRPAEQKFLWRILSVIPKSKAVDEVLRSAGLVFLPVEQQAEYIAAMNRLWPMHRSAAQLRELSRMARDSGHPELERLFAEALRR